MVGVHVTSTGCQKGVHVPTASSLAAEDAWSDRPLWQASDSVVTDHLINTVLQPSMPKLPLDQALCGEWTSGEEMWGEGCWMCDGSLMLPPRSAQRGVQCTSSLHSQQLLHAWH